MPDVPALALFVATTVALLLVPGPVTLSIVARGLDQGRAAAQILLFGDLFMLLGPCTDGADALLAGSLGGWLRGNARFLRIRRYASGGTSLALGVGPRSAARRRPSDGRETDRPAVALNGYTDSG